MAIESYNPNPFPYKQPIDSLEESQLIYQQVPTKAAATTSATGISPKLIRVLTDESQAGAIKTYLYEGSKLTTPGTLIGPIF